MSRGTGGQIRSEAQDANEGDTELHTYIVVKASENLLCGCFSTATTATATIAASAISSISEFLIDESEFDRLSIIDTGIRVPDAAHDLIVYRLPDDVGDIDESESSDTEPGGPLEDYRNFQAVGALTERWHKTRKLRAEARMTGLVMLDESILEDRVVEATDRAHLGEIARELAGGLERRLDRRGSRDAWRIVVTDQTGGRRHTLVEYKYRARATGRRGKIEQAA